MPLSWLRDYLVQSLEVGGSATMRPFWQRYYASLNLTLPPPNATGSNPTLLLHSGRMGRGH